jgi:methionine salvage enolase-phosphatase E1
MAMESFDPETTLLIDDNLEVLEAAEQYGIKNLLAVRRPDSQGKEVETQSYEVLDGFGDITPIE